MFRIGFLLEGRSDEEQPEHMLGCGVFYGGWWTIHVGGLTTSLGVLLSICDSSVFFRVTDKLFFTFVFGLLLPVSVTNSVFVSSVFCVVF